jgi:hypothetical protein
MSTPLPARSRCDPREIRCVGGENLTDDTARTSHRSTRSSFARPVKFVRAGDLPYGDVDAVPEVDQADFDQERGDGGLVVVLAHLSEVRLFGHSEAPMPTGWSPRRKAGTRDSLRLCGLGRHWPPAMERVLQHLRGVQRDPACPVEDLSAAREAVRDEKRVARGCPDRWQQLSLRHAH